MVTMKLMHEIEIYGYDEPPKYIYIEADEDIEIDHPKDEIGKVTHITTVDTDMGLEPDLIISRRK
jgi:hypothetical protein